MSTLTSLKRDARHHYELYMRIFDDMDCGHQMAQHISADAATHARGFDDALEQLARIDPTCPKMRLTVREAA